MSDSLEKQVRSALEAWAEGLSWTTTPTVTTEAPQPAEPPDLPTMALWFQSVRTEAHQPRVVEGEGEGASGIATWDVGQKEATFLWRVRCGSYEQAETFLSEMNRHQVLRSLESGDADALVLRLTASIFDHDCHIKVYWSGATDLSEPAQTGIPDLWMVTLNGLVEYPWLEQEESPGTGLMDISVEVNADGMFDLEDYEVDDYDDEED